MSTFNDKPDIKQVRCPQCQTRVPWTEDSLFRPFCSKRCQLIDFGDWANEKHSIPTKEVPEDFKLDDFED